MKQWGWCSLCHAWEPNCFKCGYPFCDCGNFIISKNHCPKCQESFLGFIGILFTKQTFLTKHFIGWIWLKLKGYKV